MADIIDFNKAKEERVVPTGDEVLSMQVYLTEDGQYELFMEIGDYDNDRIFDALSACAAKFAIDHELVESYTNETYRKDPAND